MAPLILLVTAGCTTIPGNTDGGRHDPIAVDSGTSTDQCERDRDCPASTPHCCDVDDDGIGKDCFQHDFVLYGQEYCGDDECIRNSDCPSAKPYCCPLPITGTAVLSCTANQAYCN